MDTRALLAVLALLAAGFLYFALSEAREPADEPAPRLEAPSVDDAPPTEAERAASDAEPAGDASGAPDETPPEPVSDPGPVGTIAGRVLMNGTPPPVEPIDRGGDPYFADAPPMFDESLLVGPDTALQWAVVSVLDPNGPLPELPDAVEVRIVDGRFVPRIAFVPKDAVLRIVNDDGTTYELEGRSDPGEDERPNPSFDGKLAGAGATAALRFTRTETAYSLRCRLHDWMQGWVVVIDHPWHALTDGMGRYELPGVPAGRHAVRVWHEVMGTREAEAFVRADDTVDASVSFGRGRR